MDRRLAEGAGPYREAFTKRLEILEELFRATRDLNDLDAIIRERGWARKYRNALR